MLSNSLGFNQIEEKVEVFIEGRSIGMLNVTKNSPDAVLEASVPKEGEYQYRLSGSQRRDEKGTEIKVKLFGTGTMKVVRGAEFVVHLSSNNTPVGKIRLERR